MDRVGSEVKQIRVDVEFPTFLGLLEPFWGEK
jgi:hypothetical protein